MRQRIRRSRHGMTLLEVIVALAVAGAALAAGAGVLGFLVDQQERSGANAIVAAASVRAAVREWLIGASIPTQGDAAFTGRHAPAGMNAPDELTFLTVAPTPIATTGTIVRLHIVNSDSGGSRGLVAELTPWRTGGSPTTVVLDADARSMRIRYLPSIHGDRQWAAEWISTSVLPSAIELAVGFREARRADQTLRAARALVGLPMLVVLPGMR